MTTKLFWLPASQSLLRQLPEEPNRPAQKTRLYDANGTEFINLEEVTAEPDHLRPIDTIITVHIRLRPGEAQRLEAPIVDSTAQDAARYRWMRAAWLEGIEDDADPVAQQAIGSVQNEAEMDEAIDAQIATGNWPKRP